jgi:hypothetical protein
VGGDVPVLSTPDLVRGLAGQMPEVLSRGRRGAGHAPLDVIAAKPGACDEIGSE